MNSQLRSRRLTAVALTALVLASCSKNGNAPAISGGGLVQGRVTLDGKPLEEVCITFVNAQTTQGMSMLTKDDGRYEMVTYQNGAMVRGLPPGDYLVAIAPGRTTTDGEIHAAMAAPFLPPGSPAPPPKAPPTAVPAKYGNYSTSGLSVTVVSGEDRAYDFDLKTKE
jgi:hypothetical protein